MKAIVQDTYGSTDVLELRDVDKPEMADDEVMVRVRAAGVDPGVRHVMAGLPYPIRLAGGLRTPRIGVPGMDLAGVVDAVGKNVARFQPGDEVFGVGKGSFAEYVRAGEDKLAPKPANLTLEQAATVAISGSTALQGLLDHGEVEPGQEVLIIGASGGVGTYAVQLAKAFGAGVTPVCSTAKGTLVIVGGEKDGRWLGGSDRQIRALMLSPFVGQKLGTFISSQNHQDLIVLKELIEAGKVTPAIDRTYPLSEAAHAIQYVAQGRARGKVVLTI